MSAPEVATETLALLETRLRRLEFLVNGKTLLAEKTPFDNTDSRATITARITSLEHNLQKLSSNSPLVQDILQLHAQHPSLFHPIAPTDVPSTLSDENLASIVLSCAASFPETASRLESLKDLPVPPASASEQLIKLQPRLDNALQKQQAQAVQVRDLREWSARILKRWYEIGVIAQGEVWSEWAERIERAERDVRRAEKAREIEYT